MQYEQTALKKYRVGTVKVCEILAGRGEPEICVVSEIFSNGTSIQKIIKNAYLL